MIIQFEGKYGSVIREERGCYFVSFADGTNRYVPKADAVEIEFNAELERLSRIVTNRIGTPQSDMTHLQAQVLSILQRISVA